MGNFILLNPINSFHNIITFPSNLFPSTSTQALHGHSPSLTVSTHEGTGRCPIITKLEEKLFSFGAA